MLKRLILSGFKSFADKTEFVFEPGLTAIVGPNGCGKSNLVDALKWVLGEQSARSLRGDQMQDVIFAGSGSRPPLGYAEVSLVLDNHTRRFSADTDEVVVTRRLYRSGESEYLLNGEPCRLRDIRDLMLDTGVGRQAYSVIEQGKVDQLLRANPLERRIIFEEAAGISKYKSRRKTAESKLARVEQNLLRVGDIIEEVERQLRSIRYQAAKARRYRQYADRLRELHLAQAAREFSTYQERRRALHADIETHSRRALALASRLRQLEARQSDAETALLEVEQELNRSRATSVELRTRASRAEQAITLTQNRLEELAHEESGLQQQVERLTRSLEAIRADLDAALSQRDRLRDRLLTVGNQLAQTREEQNLLEVHRGSIQNQLQNIRAAILQLTHQTTQRENELRACEAQQESLQRERQRLQERQQELARELAELARREEDLTRSRQEAEGRRAELRSRAARLAEARDDLARRCDRLAEELGLVRREEATKRGRLRVLRELEANLEGVDLAVKKLLERVRSAEGGPRLEGIVAQLISVPSTYAPAVDAALGPAAQAVVTPTLAEALACRALLSGESGGSVQLLPLERLSGDGPERDRESSPGIPGGPGVLGPLSERVTVEPRYRAVVRSLLGNVLLVEDVQAGLQLQLELTRPLRLVTPQGELIEPDGRLVLGAGRPGTGLVSRGSQIAELEEELGRLEADIARREAELEAQGRRREVLEASHQRLAREVAEAEEGLRRTDLALEQLAAARRTLQEEGQVLQSEVRAVEAELTSLQERRQGLTEEIAALAAQRTQKEQAAAEHVRELQSTEARAETLAREMTELKVAQAQVEEQHAGVEVTVANLTKALREREEERNYTLTQLDICRGRQRTAAEEVAEARKTLTEARHQLQSLEEAAAGLEDRRAALRRELTSNNEEAKRLRADLEAEQEQLQRLELADSELRLKQENLTQRINEDYQVSLTEHLEELLTEERDWEAVAQEIVQLRQKIARLGNVNLEAIQEEEALSQRAEFLRRQYEDLERSKATLERVIARINRRCRSLFLETFQAVRGHFQELFRKLFGGGRADIFLADEHDVLESGIEIIAKPPGKEPKGISLLSGGEKTLTAVAILFAIFRSKPSPFCILDEVDAAMDEANVERFLAVLREFLKESQFILITHCKRTMAEADCIYGVTMQEPGVSTRVAVRLEEAEALAAPV